MGKYLNKTGRPIMYSCEWALYDRSHGLVVSILIIKKMNRTQALASPSCKIYLFIYLGFYLVFNTVQVISRQVVGRAEETSTYSSSGFCTVNCQPTASNYQLSHLRPCRELNPGLRGGRWECYHRGPPPQMLVLLSLVLLSKTFPKHIQMADIWLISEK